MLNSSLKKRFLNFAILVGVLVGIVNTYMGRYTSKKCNDDIILQKSDVIHIFERERYAQKLFGKLVMLGDKLYGSNTVLKWRTFEKDIRYQNFKVIIPRVTGMTPDYNDESISTGIWSWTNEYYLDYCLAQALSDFLYSCSVLELGAGVGFYSKFFLFLSKVTAASPYEGNIDISQITDGFVRHADLSVKLDLSIHDWVLCLEVAEHIPSNFENMLVENILFHARKGIIISWATPGQGGQGHVNERSLEYVIDLFEKKGLSYDRSASISLRAKAYFGYFKSNILVFRVFRAAF